MKRLFLILLILIGSLACSELKFWEDDDKPAGDVVSSDTSVPEGPAPRIQSVVPFGLYRGETARIRGMQFGDDSISVSVRMSGSKTFPTVWPEVVSVTDTEIEFIVPVNALTGPLYVEVGGQRSNAVYVHVNHNTYLSKHIRVFPPEKTVEEPGGAKVAADHVFIQMKNTNEGVVNMFEKEAGLPDFIGKIWQLNLLQYKVEAETWEDLEQVMAELETYDNVAAVYPNIEDKTDVVTTDVSTSLTGDPLAHYQQMRIPEAWDFLQQQSDDGQVFFFVGVGVIERALDLRHIELDGYKGGMSVDGIVLTGTDDNKQHGTVVTSIIAGLNDGGEINGVLTGVPVGGFGINVGRPSSFAMDGIATIESLMEQGVSVMNMSFGFTRDTALQSDGSALASNANPLSAKTFDKGRKLYETFFEDAAEEYPRVVFVASAGNGNADAREHIPGGMRYDNLITVAAVDSSGLRADFSCYGPGVDIAASGADVMVPDVEGAAVSDTTIDDYGTGPGQGTSYAAPFVTSAVALMQATDPALLPMDIKRILRETSTPIQSEGVSVTDENGDTSVLPLTQAHPHGNGTEGCLLNLEGALKAVMEARNEVGIDDPIELTMGKHDLEDITVDLTVDEDLIPKMDVVLLVDVSSSFDDDIETMKDTAYDIMDGLSVHAKDVRFGVASFSDFPISPYGKEGDDAYQLRTPLTDDMGVVFEAVANLNNPLHNGGDPEEAQLEAIYQVLTGLGRDINDDGDYDDAGEIPPSDMGWRSGALPILVLATDAGFHHPDEEDKYNGEAPVYPGPTWGVVENALKMRGVTIVGLDSGNTGGNLADIVDYTDGLFYQLESDGSGVAEAILEAAQAITDTIELRMETVGDVLGFVSDISPEVVENAQPGETYTFFVELSSKVSGHEGAVIPLLLRILGEGTIVLKQQTVLITIPTD